MCQSILKAFLPPNQRGEVKILHSHRSRPLSLRLVRIQYLYRALQRTRSRRQRQMLVLWNDVQKEYLYCALQRNKHGVLVVTVSTYTALFSAAEVFIMRSSAL